MRIIIVGCGKVGATIIRQLSNEGHDITIVDIDRSVVEETANAFDVMGVVGNGASYHVLKDAGIDTADLLLAVTDSDEQNLLTCLIAKKVGGCSTIARVRNPIYSEEVRFISEELGLSMIINPEMTAAQEIARILRFPAAVKIDTFAKGKVEILKFIVPEGSLLDGCALGEISKKVKADILICTVERKEEAIIPNGSFVLKAEDKVSIVSSPAHAREFFKRIGINIQRVRDVLIVGGGKMAYYLADMLQSTGIQVKIIEQDEERCRQLADSLPKAQIICADGTDQDVLLEEGVTRSDAFVSLTGIDEENILLSLYVHTVSKAKIVTKVNRSAFSDVIASMDLGSVIYPKYITADHIVRYVRAKQNAEGNSVESLYHLIDNKVEALEFKVQEDTELCNIPLEKLPIRKNVLVACIYRDGKTLIPNGKSEIRAGDTVIVVSGIQGFHDLKDILEEKA